MVRSGSATARHGNILTCVKGKFGGKFVIVEQINVYTFHVSKMEATLLINFVSCKGFKLCRRLKKTYVFPWILANRL